MSHRMIGLPRFNTSRHFNYFFKNTKYNLRIDQNFINNQFLSSANRKFVISSKRSQSERKQLSSKGETSSILENVATKVLNCQDSESNSSQSTVYSKVPFEVTPKSTISESNKKIDGRSKNSLMTLINPYLKLTKPNLTILVTLSSICSYAISPYSVSLQELVFLTLGTALCSGSANAINMGREPEFDRKMPRTVGRPVVRGLVSSEQAFQFAGCIGTLGCSMLYFGVNPTVSILGFMNIVLYAWIYTSLKRKSIINTWVGAIVGAIPPLMGWAAASPLSHPAAWCLAGLLYAWQFPHFNALSHNIADQYKQAGYVMTAAENPKLNARVALRYSLLMFPLCFGLTFYGITDWVFPIDSAVANGWLTLLAYKFWNQQRINYRNGTVPTAEGLALAGVHAKQLFWCSVWHLPAILILAMLHKKGQWDRLWTYIGFGRKSTNNPLPA